MAFPLFGALLGGLASGFATSGFNALAQSRAMDNSKELSAFGAQQQLDVLARSGAAQNVANKALGRSSAFAQNGISVPSSSSVNQSALPATMSGFDGLISALSDLSVKKQDVKTGQAQEKLLGEQATTEKKRQDEIDANIKSLEANANKTNKEADKILLDTQAQEILNRYLDEQKSAEIRNLNANSEKIDKELNIAFKKLPYELKQIAAATYQANTQGNLNTKSVELVGEQINKCVKEIENFDKIWENLDADTKVKLSQNGINEQTVRSVTSKADIDNINLSIVRSNLPAYKRAELARWFKDYREAYLPISFMIK